MGAKAILNEVRSLQCRLDLSGNNISKDVVGEWLWSSCNIFEMRLSGTFVLPVQDVKGAYHIHPPSSTSALRDPHENEMSPPPQTLSLLDQDIGPLEQEALAQCFRLNTVCTELNGIIFDTEIETVDLSLAPLELYEIIFVARRLDLNFSIRSLNLSGCAVDAEGSVFLAQSIGSHKTLKQLRIDNNLLADGGARVFGRYLRENNSLNYMDMSYNAISDAGCSALLSGILCDLPNNPTPLLSPQTTVSTISTALPLLSGGDEKTEQVPSSRGLKGVRLGGATAILENIEGPTYLIDDGDNEETKQRKAIELRKEGSAEKKRGPPLEIIDMSGNHIGYQTLRALGRSPMGYTPQGRSRFSLLKELCMRSVSLTDGTMEALARALYHKRATQTKKGRRSYNGSGCHEVSASNTVGFDDEPEGPRFPHLETLDVRGHHCCDDGLVELCQSLQKLPSLTTLRLGRASVTATEFDDNGESSGKAAGVGGPHRTYPTLKSSKRALRSIIEILQLHAVSKSRCEGRGRRE